MHRCVVVLLSVMHKVGGTDDQSLLVSGRRQRFGEHIGLDPCRGVVHVMGSVWKVGTQLVFHPFVGVVFGRGMYWIMHRRYVVDAPYQLWIRYALKSSLACVPRVDFTGVGYEEGRHTTWLCF